MKHTPLEALSSMRPAICSFLNSLEFQQTGSDPKTNGFAYAKVPDWCLKQWLELIDEAAKAEGK